jgi:hypothetical protein
MTNLRNMINADVTELITFQPCAIFIAFLEVTYSGNTIFWFPATSTLLKHDKRTLLQEL